MSMVKKVCLRLLVAVVMLTIAGTADASIIVSWNFDDSTKNPAFTDTHVTASIFDSADGSVTFPAGNPALGKSIADDTWKTPGNYFYFGDPCRRLHAELGESDLR